MRPRISIKATIMKMEALAGTEADALIEEARTAFWDYLDDGNNQGVENICQEYFGLEMDCLDEFI